MEQPADESAIKRQPRPEEWIKRLLPKQKAIIIAIDFGTTFSGVAYSTEALAVSDKSVPLTELRELIRRVDVLRVWPEIDQSYQEKTATRLAYQDGKVLAWGGKVNDLRHKTIVEYFKLGLQENPAQLKTESLQLHAFACDTNWKHSELPDKTAEDYTADFMKQLYQWVRPKLPFAPKFLSSNQVEYVLTVPAMWGDKAKDATRRAAVRAGMPVEDLHLITEPEAAAVYCATMCEQVDLQKGDCFVICDAGGGTVVRSSYVTLIVRILLHTS